MYKILPPTQVRRGIGVLSYLTPSDFPWLLRLMDEFRRFEGQQWRLLQNHLQQPLPFDVPPAKIKVALNAMLRLWGSQIHSTYSPKEIGGRLFAAAANAATEGRQAIVERIASELGLTSCDLDDALFADLPGEQRVHPPEEIPAPASLAATANLAMVQGLLRRSTQVNLRVWGNSRALIRQAKLRGLLCAITQPGGDVVEICMSGPLTLFRRTILYGRALAGLVPLLPWCHRFHLTADLLLNQQVARLSSARSSGVRSSAGWIIRPG